MPGPKDEMHAKRGKPASVSSGNAPSEWRAPGLFSYVRELVCWGCGARYPVDQVHTYCLECQSPLMTQYDLDAVRAHVDRDLIAAGPYGMWRWHELLPLVEPGNIVSLGEGDTPLLRLPHVGQELGLINLYLKDESKNPTGSFKARGLAAAVSRAKELQIQKVIIPTAGNAGGAMAAYAARAAMKALIYMPKDSPHANVEESRMAGADVVLVDGIISDAAGMAGEKARAEGWFDLSTFKEPYRVEGKKVMGYELAQELGWSLPDVIIYPTGGGTGLVGMCKAFDELAALGWLENTKRPRMVAVQANGCAPVVRAFHSGSAFCDFWTHANTVASGLRVPKSFADAWILHDLRASAGTAVAVSDDSILQAQRWLGRAEGIFAAPEGAATLAALQDLVRQHWIAPEERVVLFNTGSGLKYLSA